MSWFLLNRNLTPLEPYDWKLSRTVLRGERGSNAPDLPGKALASANMSNYIRYLFKTVRKFFGEAVVVTQEVEDIISCDALSETENEYVDTPAPNGGSQTYKKGYTITLTGLDYGTYDFWVVANPTEANEAYKSCQSLDALKEIIEGGDSYQTAFAEKADQLVKVGNKSATFNATTVASPIQIPLTQLAARVELKVRVDIPRQLKGGEYVYEGFPNANGVLTNAEIDKLTGSHIRNEDVIDSDLQRKDGNDNYLYTYFGHPVTISGGSKVKAIRVDNALKVTKQTTYSGYLLDNIKLTVDNIRIKVNWTLYL